jgi:hypothetical protein
MTKPLDLDALSALAEAAQEVIFATRAINHGEPMVWPEDILALIARVKRFEAAIRVERIEAILHDYEGDIVADAQHDGRLNCATFAAVLHEALAAR